LLADRPGHVEAVAARQHHVQHDHVERRAGGARDRGVAIAGSFDRVAFGRQPIAQRQLQAGLVFNEEKALLGQG
jgi:hypothetical protein